MKVKIQSPDKIITAKKKKKNLRIMIDMDGVCSFWVKAACDIFDLDMNDKDLRKKILENTGKFEKAVDKSDEEMWEKIGKAGIEFWSGMELLPWAKRLWKEMRKISEEVSFLSSPSDVPTCAQGKVEWINKNFDTKDFIITPRKKYCASKNCLLIDDQKKQIKRFEDGGGHGFLWPDPIALFDEEDLLEETFEKLHKKIDKLID